MFPPQTRLASNKVSSQLRYMIKSGHIAEVASQPKKKSYMLADRFSNVHYLMRHGRAARIRFDWFVVMVRLLFEDEEYAKALGVMAKDSVIGIAPGWDEACGLVANAMDRAETSKARKLLIGQFVTAQTPESIADLQLAEIACNKALEIDPNDAEAYFKKGRVEEYLTRNPLKLCPTCFSPKRIHRISIVLLPRERDSLRNFWKGVRHQQGDKEKGSNRKFERASLGKQALARAAE